MPAKEIFRLENLSQAYGSISLIELPGTVSCTENSLSCVNWFEYRKAYDQSLASTGNQSGLYGRVSLKVPAKNINPGQRHNPWSHPIIGSIVSPLTSSKSNRFIVLRVTKCPCSDKIIKISIIGFSSSICLFRDMADFSFLPKLDDLAVMDALDVLKSEPRTLNLDFVKKLSDSLRMKLGQDELKKILFPPPFFTLSSVPTPIKFNQAASSYLKKEISLMSHRRRSKKSIFYYCSIDPNDNRPACLTECPDEFFSAYRPKISDDLYELLLQMFAERPIWTSLALKNSLKRPISLRRELPLVAYYYPKGPWRHCWVRYGVSPCLDRNMAKYQIFEVRCFTGSGENTPISTNSHIIEADRLPCTKGNIVFQFCDVLDPALRLILDSPNSLLPDGSSCCPKDGWYRPECRPKLLAMLKLKWRVHIKEYPLRSGGGSLRLSAQPSTKPPTSTLANEDEKDDIWNFQEDDSDSSYSIFEEEDQNDEF
ncbi:tau 95 subunit of transcription factor TFIIIC [Mitosporidium daphniae]